MDGKIGCDFIKAVTINNLSFSYEADSPQVLTDITVDIDEGSFVAVLGHNGSGKSTLAKHFNAIYTPTAGTVEIFGMDTTKEDLLWDIRKKAGMVFQNPDNQMVSNIVEEDVAFACENLALPPDEIRKRVDESLLAVGMQDYALHAPHLLSGGQKQRIAIAGILAMEPQIIILDEATAMLDPIGRREVIAAVQKLNREKGLTIIHITHHMDEAALADRLLLLSGGRLVMDGAPRDIFAQIEEIEKHSIYPPQTVELLDLLNKKGASLPLTALSPLDCAEAIYAAKV